jgi:hypothetical protein
MGLTSRPSTPKFRDHFDQTFHHKHQVSKYKVEWKAFSKNEEFWREVLVGRKIVDIQFNESHLCALKLDSGELVKIINNEDGKGVLCIED